MIEKESHVSVIIADMAFLQLFKKIWFEKWWDARFS